MARVPEQVIAEIRERTDMVELVGSYVSLKKSGRNFQGLCPFHQEKTPSFNVNPERQIYHCFGCGETGDAYKFLMEHDHMSFPEALRHLAERVGIDLSPYERDSGAGRSDFDLLYRAHAVAVRLYRNILKKNEGKPAREEIARRGLSEEIVDEYRIGASSPSWDRLLSAAKREGIEPAVMERAGLAIRKESGGWYDRFRGRLMFPIDTISGKTIGFGGRVLGEGEPKYLNSPESPLFHKRKTLYGYSQAKSVLRENRHAILVEGYTDVLALANAGIRSAVASLGTAFTTDHAEQLARNCDKVTVLFDGDEAGRQAAHVSAGPLLGAGLEVRIVLLPAGEDPDSLLREHGREGLEKRIESARGLIETLLGDEAYWGGGAAQERGVKRVLSVLAPIQDPVRRKAYLEELAVTVGVRSSLPAELLEKELRRLRDAEKESRRSAVESQPEVHRAARVLSERPSAVERTFVGVLVHDPELGRRLLEKIGPEDMDNALTRRIVEKAGEIAAAGGAPEPAALLEAFRDDPEATELLGELAVSDQYAVESARQAEDCLSAMERRGLEREMDAVMREMRKAKAEGDAELVLDCARKRSELARGIARLATKDPFLTT